MITLAVVVLEVKRLQEHLVAVAVLELVGQMA